MKKVNDHNDPLYKGWVQNVKSLNRSRSNLKRIINRTLKASNPPDSNEIETLDLEVIEFLTKSYFIIYSSYTEAMLLKLLYLPNSYTQDEVSIVLNLKKNNVISAWLKAIEIALNKNTLPVNGGVTKEDCNERLRYITKKYLKEPSLLRNKLVHGQWSVAYKSNLLALDSAATTKISEVDYVKIDVWFQIFNMFADILIQLIQSPNKGFPSQYYSLIEKIELFAIKSQQWNLRSKKYELISKGPINFVKELNI